MLTPPEYGWTEFSPNEETGFSLGYVTDVAMEWLDMAIAGLTHGNPFVVKGFCEPGWMVCAVTWNECLVYWTDDVDLPDIFHTSPEIICPMTSLAFCRALRDDVAGHLAEWVNWALYDEDDSEADERRAERESALRTRLDSLDALIRAEETREEEGEE